MVDSRFFKVSSPLTLEQISKISECEVVNSTNDDIIIEGVAPIQRAKPNEATFLANNKYSDFLYNCKAGACFISEKDSKNAPKEMTLLISNNPYYSYAKLADALYSSNENNNSNNIYIDETASVGKNCKFEHSVVISANAKIGDNCFIGANSYIGSGVEIGNNCHIYQNVTVTYSIISDNVVIHNGARIGQDGFGFATHNGKHFRVPQLGRVIIENNVDIGANSCIDRGSGPDTIIGEGCMLDNLVQIGHNVQLGKGCIIVSQVGISGSTKLGDYVVLGGQAGVAGHLNVGDGVRAAAQAGITKNIEPMRKVGGTPAVNINDWHRQAITLSKLIKSKKNDQ